jgi:hypothetical protein
MRTHLEFQSSQFNEPGGQGNTYNPEIQGGKLAAFLSEQFKSRGFTGIIIEEDWGWMVELKSQPFPVWLGCSSYGDQGSWLVFIEPSKPAIRKWFSKIDTRAEVEAIAVILEQVVVASGGATDLNWWSDQDSGRK